MPSVRGAAWTFCGLAGVVILFQVALALGVPWGEYAMGGLFRGTYPPAMRFAAAIQAVQMALMAAVVLVKADILWPRMQARWGRLAWAVAFVFLAGVVLNVITPSSNERLIWAPVAILMFLASLRVASAPGKPSLNAAKNS